MEREYRKDSQGHYLITEYEGKRGDYREKMLVNNCMDGILSTEVQEIDGKRQLWFDITGKTQALEEFRRNSPSVSIVCELFCQLENAAKQIEQYMMDTEDLWIDLETIFTDGDKFWFAYIPGRAENTDKQLDYALEQLMSCMNYDDSGLVSLVYLLHARNKQKSGGLFCLKEMCEKILAAKEENREEEAVDGKGKSGKRIPSEIDPVTGEIINGAGFVEGCEREYDESVRETKRQSEEILESGLVQKGKNWILNKFRQFMRNTDSDKEDYEEEETEYRTKHTNERRDDFDDTSINEREKRFGYVGNAEENDTVLLTNRWNEEEEGDTVLLSAMIPQYGLEPVESGRETIKIGDYPFILGKKVERDEKGYVFSELTVSRRHAKIVKQENEFYLVDTESLNGTYLNGTKLLPNECREVREGDVVGIADIHYIFTCLNSSNAI